MSAWDLAGKVAVVTGAGRNLGRSICLALARDGADVAVVVGSRTVEAEAVAGEVRGLGRRALPIVADVGSPTAVAGMARTVAGELGGADVLVNCAAVRPHAGFLELPDADWERVLAVDVRGPVAMCRALLPQMLGRGRGSIVNVSGSVAYTGGQAQLAAAKAFLIGLTRGLAVEFGGRGIRVNALVPSALDTQPERRIEGARRAQELAQTPLGRLGLPEEAAEVCAFLASDRSSYLTGQAIHVNGGRYLG